jgi:hypothetical protein
MPEKPGFACKKLPGRTLPEKLGPEQPSHLQQLRDHVCGALLKNDTAFHREGGQPGTQGKTGVASH